jgi:hypothetical protein
VATLNLTVQILTPGAAGEGGNLMDKYELTEEQKQEIVRKLLASDEVKNAISDMAKAVASATKALAEAIVDAIKD